MGKFTAYKLPLKSLAKGSHEFDYALGKQFFADMENTDIRNADVKVRLTVVYNGDVYDLSFVFTGEITVLCDRCLDDLVLPIDTTYHIMVKYGEDFNDDSDELLEIPDSDNYLNVAYMMYDRTFYFLIDKGAGNVTISFDQEGTKNGVSILEKRVSVPLVLGEVS